MKITRSRVYQSVFLTFVSLFSLVTSAVFAQSAVPPPIVTGQTASGFTVSYSACSSCAGHGMEAFNQATGAWEYIGSAAVPYTGLAAGTYRFHTVYMFQTYYGQYYPAYSPEVSVSLSGSPVVTNPPAPPDPTAVGYQSWIGDIDYNGVPELILRAPGSGSGGTRDVMLRQAGGGKIAASRPTPAELASASGWQPAALDIVARDVNIDGKGDLVLRGVADVPGFQQVQNQIVFGVTDGDVQGTLKSKNVDPALARFSRDINRHLIDPEYYPNNAPLVYATIVYITPYCSSYQYDWWGETSFVLPCFTYINYYYVAFRDYSIYDWEAMRIASDDYAMIHGNDTPVRALTRIDTVLERVLGIAVGGRNIRDLLGDQPLDDATIRGMDLFAVIAGISDAAAQEPDGGSALPDGERVLLKGRRVLGQGPYHTALEYRGSTVSAYDSDSRALFDGTLVSQVNWPNDHPMLTLRHGYVDGPVTPLLYWASLLAADQGYDDDLTYDLFPSIGHGGYNSNSFVSGLINATFGISTVPMAKYVGGERPVPASEFN